MVVVSGRCSFQNRHNIIDGDVPVYGLVCEYREPLTSLSSD